MKITVTYDLSTTEISELGAMIVAALSGSNPFPELKPEHSEPSAEHKEPSADDIPL